MFRNWITTLCGLVAGSPFIVEGIRKHDWWLILSGVALAAFGAGAKDVNKTGAMKVLE